MLATATSAAVHGVEAKLVRIETDISGGFPRFTMLGLPDSCVKESEGRDYKNSWTEAKTFWQRER